MTALPYVLFAAALVVGLVVLVVPTMRRWLNDNSDSLTVAFALIAGTYVLIEYRQDQEEQRLNRARSYIERIESGTVHESRQWFDLHWIANRDLIRRIDKANYGSNANKEQAKALTEQYMIPFGAGEADSEGVKHMMRLFYFYSDLAKCVQLNLCDTQTSCDMFGDDIARFYVLHSDFVLRWREVAFEKNFDAIKSFLNDRCELG